MRLFVFLIPIIAAQAGLEKCPMPLIRSIIVQVSALIKNPEFQMVVIRQNVERLYGGAWGVLIVENATWVSEDVHWTIPDLQDAKGTPAFCLAVVKGWQYNVFLAGVRYRDRDTSEDDKPTTVEPTSLSKD